MDAWGRVTGDGFGRVAPASRVRKVRLIDWPVVGGVDQTPNHHAPALSPEALRLGFTAPDRYSVRWPTDATRDLVAFQGSLWSPDGLTFYDTTVQWRGPGPYNDRSVEMVLERGGIPNLPRVTIVFRTSHTQSYDHCTFPGKTPPPPVNADTLATLFVIEGLLIPSPQIQI